MANDLKAHTTTREGERVCYIKQAQAEQMMRALKAWTTAAIKARDNGIIEHDAFCADHKQMQEAFAQIASVAYAEN